MGQQSAKPINVAEEWAKEEKMTLAKRRQRYGCGDRFVAADKIVRWSEVISDVLDEDAALGRAFQSARIDERDRQMLELTRKKAEKAQKEVDESPPPKDEDDFEARWRVSRAKRLVQEVSEKEHAIKMKNTPYLKRTADPELNKKVAMIRADITRLEVDAIVNAANRQLLGGGGIDGAIHRAAGDRLFDECYTLNGAETGETKITRGYCLPARFVLHSVGPIGMNEKELESCYKTCLDLVLKHNIKTVAFCGISTGIFGYPLYNATHMALKVVREWLEDPSHAQAVDKIIFCTYLAKEEQCYHHLMPLYFPPSGKSTDEILEFYQKGAAKYDPSTDKELQAEIRREVLDEERMERWREEQKKKSEAYSRDNK